MPHASWHRHLWLALSVIVGGLLAMGSVALGSRPDFLNRVTARVKGIPATAAARPTATALPSPTAAATVAPGATPIAAPTATQAPATELPADGQARTALVPILMYHYISDLPADADDIRVDLTVTPAAFEAQLAYLQAQGYASITLDDLALYLKAGRALPPKPIIITFDDGYLDNYLYAFPLLRQYKFSGTFFVVTQFLDEGRSGYMSWEQAQLMQANGMDIESHSVSHEELRGQSVEFLTQQIASSRQAIEAHLHKPVHFLCYPFGHYDERAIEVLRSAGYWGAVTTAFGAQHSSAGLFELPRVRIHGAQDLDKFKTTLVSALP